MGNVVMYLVALLAVILVVMMLIKKMDIKITLLFMGVILMYVGMLMGNDIALSSFETTGSKLLDPFAAIATQFKSTLSSSGFIVLILGGYSCYMSTIKANEVTVQTFSKPIRKIKSVYFLVPAVFLLGNLLSLVVPSASNLAIILLATLYPILIKSGMSPLTAAAIIATTATVMPTPLGSDNVAIAAELANTTEFAGLTVSDYVFRYHAKVSIPVLLLMAVVHYFWQKHEDKKQGVVAKAEVEVENVEEIEGSGLFKVVYSILPLFPLIVLIIMFILQSTIGTTVTVSVESACIVSFVFAIICEIIRNKDIRKALKDTEGFFKGMGNAVPTVVLMVSATIFVVGLQSIGLINALKSAMLGINGSGMGFVLPLILVLLSALIVILSGSGTSLFFALVPLMAPLAEAAGISVLAISIPMGLAGNLLRAVSPVSAVVMIVAGTTKNEPMQIVRRTAIPMIAGVIFMFILSMIMFL